LGDLAVARGEAELAATHFQTDMDLAKRLVELQPDNVQALRDLSISHERLGDLAVARGEAERSTAERHFSAGLMHVDEVVGRLGSFGDFIAFGRHFCARLSGLWSDHTDLAPDAADLALVGRFLSRVQTMGIELSDAEAALVEGNLPPHPA
jgi:uncharacterized protein YjiS (DUF1127 family)